MQNRKLRQKLRCYAERFVGACITFTLQPQIYLDGSQKERGTEEKGGSQAAKRGSVNSLTLILISLKHEQLDQKRREETALERRRFLAEKKRHEERKEEKKALLESLRWNHLPPMRTKRRYLGVAISPDGTKLYDCGTCMDT